MSTTRYETTLDMWNGVSPAYAELCRAAEASGCKHASIARASVEQFCTACWHWMAFNNAGLRLCAQPSGQIPGGPPSQTPRPGVFLMIF